MSKFTEGVLWVLGTLALGIFINVLDRYFNFNIYPDSITNFFSRVWNGIIAAFTYRIPVWIILVVILIIVVHLQADKAPFNTSEALSDNKIPFQVYTKDKFGSDNSLWGWQWSDTKLINVAPICPVCENLTYVNLFKTHHSLSSKTIAECPKCRLDGRNHTLERNEDVQDIKHEILRRIRTGEYKRSMGKPTL